MPPSKKPPASLSAVIYHVGQRAGDRVVLFDDAGVAADWVLSRPAGAGGDRRARFDFDDKQQPVVVEVFATPQAATAAIGPALDEVEPGAFKAARKRRAAREAEEKAEQERIEREAREARERAEALERARQERAAANAADLERLRSQGFTEDSIAAFEQMQKIAAARRETASNNNTKEN